MQHIVRDRQTLPDIAVQTTGSIETLFDIAQINDISITELLNTGSALETVSEVNSEAVINFRTTKTIPAANQNAGVSNGIGFYIIGANFIVS